MVSVILPVYNGENYLRFAIDSVISQTLQDFELVIVDDGSKDSTPEIVRGYGERVRYVPQKNTGVAGAFNHGLSLANGRYISWLSHDDVFHPTKLEKQVAALEKVGGPAVCYTDMEMIDANGDVVRQHKLPEHDRDHVMRHILTADQVCSACYSVMYDRRCIEAVGQYSVELRYTQDVDMLSRLAHRFPLIHVPEMLMQVRDHDDRGIRSKEWAEAVPRFFRERLHSFPFAELFPEYRGSASKQERSDAYLWLADKFAALPFPLYRVAFSQYRRALTENPLNARLLLRRIVRLYWLSRRNSSKL